MRMERWFDVYGPTNTNGTEVCQGPLVVTVTGLTKRGKARWDSETWERIPPVIPLFHTQSDFPAGALAKVYITKELV